MKGLTQRQKSIFDYIQEFIEKNHYSPSFREIQSYFGFSSLSSVHKHVQALQKKGYLNLDKFSARSILPITNNHSQLHEEFAYLPIIGQLTIGMPMEMFSNFNAKIAFPKKLLPSPSSCYVIQVVGERLNHEMIANNDLLIVEAKNQANDGEIVLASLPGGNTLLKRYYYENFSVKLDSIHISVNESAQMYDPQELSIQAVLLYNLRDYQLSQ